MVATISAITSGASRVRYFEQEGYYAKDDPAHRQASRWYGAGALSLIILFQFGLIIRNKFKV